MCKKLFMPSLEESQDEQVAAGCNYIKFDESFPFFHRGMVGISTLRYLQSICGDQDSVVPFIGSRILVEGLAKELGLNATVPCRPRSAENHQEQNLVHRFC
ncbi:hypothetical protein SADUNF_Sadunf16G0030800 [Salix dunnii]|uniref:Uncharacterized protein n=1 Tax=Salix dunnii TaxID=1413687 RepID=A0A835JC40_9ROSI|nr:hypothetical protein SADUNF_Sadunf16G0030800 [Salix dunnii]